jgi:hypothetical protein
MTWRFLGIAFVLALLVVVVVLFLIIGPEPFQFVLQVPDGNNLLKNGSFEGGDANNNPTAGEVFIQAANEKLLCDGSTTIDGWVAHGLGQPNAPPCPNRKSVDAVAYVANPPECPPNVPPCPNFVGVAAQEGNRFVNLTGVASRPPRNYGSVSQDVQTNVGQTYELSFFIGSSSAATGGPFGAVSVEIAGVTIPDNPFPAPPPQTASNWSGPQKPPRFDAVNTTTTLTFRGTTAPPGEANGPNYIGLDNVSLQKVCFIITALTVGCP